MCRDEDVMLHGIVCDEEEEEEDLGSCAVYHEHQG
jgi:hypothetical protein